MINRKVKLKESYAKWHLDHPDVYGNGSTFAAKLYEKETLMHLVCCLGEPVYGKVLDHGVRGCWLVEFKVGNWSMSYYVSRHHVEVL